VTDVRPDLQTAVEEACERARAAGPALAAMTGAARDAVLVAVADALAAAAEDLLAANAVDVGRARFAGVAGPSLDRLALDAERVLALVRHVRDVAAAPDPVGQVLDEREVAPGRVLRRTRVPLGVIAVVTEASPDAVVDAVALALRSGNAVVLRAGTAARQTSLAVVAAVQGALEAAGAPPEAVQGLDGQRREAATALVRAQGLVDLVVPRGGSALVQRVLAEATVPVLRTASGGGAVVVDAGVDAERALVLCRAAAAPAAGGPVRTVLVHADAAGALLEPLLGALAADGARLRGDAAARAAAPPGVLVRAAREDDWAGEGSGTELAVGVVDDLGAALEQRAVFSSGHTEVLLTTSGASATRFVDGVGAATVLVNPPLEVLVGPDGAAPATSVQRVHARGPLGAAELMTTRWVLQDESLGAGPARA